MEGSIISSGVAIGWPSNSDYLVPWDTETKFGSTYDFFDAGTSTTRLVIPTGVTNVEIFQCAAADGFGATGVDSRWVLMKNGADYMVEQVDNQQWAPHSLRTGVITVTPGDYFQFEYRTYGGTGDCQETATRMVVVVNPMSHLLGALHAVATTDISIAGDTSPVWGTPDIDNLSTQYSTTEFEAPTDALFAVVSSNGSIITPSSGWTNIKSYKNGTVVGAALRDNQSTPSAGILTPIPVTAGDLLKVTYFRSGATLDGSETHINIEWYG